MDRSLQDLVWRRAGDMCEYCLLPSTVHPIPYQIDHIIAQQHREQLVNLALSAFAATPTRGQTSPE
jgi:hypothetical protein